MRPSFGVGNSLKRTEALTHLPNSLPRNLQPLQRKRSDTLPHTSTWMVNQKPHPTHFPLLHSTINLKNQALVFSASTLPLEDGAVLDPVLTNEMEGRDCWGFLGKIFSKRCRKSWVLTGHSRLPTLFIIFLKDLFLFIEKTELQRERRDRKIFYLLVHLPNSSYNQSWLPQSRRQEPEVSSRSSTWV